jgi:hypothetical protein
MHSSVFLCENHEAELLELLSNLSQQRISTS